MSQKTILLVDDSEIALMIQKMILSNGSYELVTAADGEEAVEKALREKPDLILLDIVMPKMDGFETCRRLRMLNATKKIPIIIVTTRGESEHVMRGFGLGCNDYVTKPISCLELISKVRNCLGDSA